MRIVAQHTLVDMPSKKRPASLAIADTPRVRVSKEHPRRRTGKPAISQLYAIDADARALHRDVLRNLDVSAKTDRPRWLFSWLQRVFTEDDLPAFRNILHMPWSAMDVLDAFKIEGDSNDVTKYNVKNLYDVIIQLRCHTAGENMLMVQAYQLTWVYSNQLDWG